MKELYTPLAYLAAGKVAVALAIRMTWELLAPALVPVSILALVVTVLYVAFRRR